MLQLLNESFGLYLGLLKLIGPSLDISLARKIWLYFLKERDKKKSKEKDSLCGAEPCMNAETYVNVSYVKEFSWDFLVHYTIV